jgi:hypothetical protein
MTEAKPPEFYFDGIVFNTQYFKDESDTIGFTQDESDARYLRKKTPDTASALQTFSAGLNFSGEINGPTIVCTTMKCNNYQSTSINQPLTLGNNQTNTGATLAIGCNVARTGNINIANTQTTGTANIVIGSTALSTGSQNITINRPLTIGYDAVSNLNNSFDKIGSYNTVNSSEANIVNDVDAATSIVNFSNVPPGLYLFNYQINYRITNSNVDFTQQKFILSTTANNFVSGNIIGGDFSSLFISNRVVGVLTTPDEYTHNISKCGTIALNGTTNIYLNYRIVIANASVTFIKASLRLVRIG